MEPSKNDAVIHDREERTEPSLVRPEKKEHPWTARRILALTGIILLLAMYAATLVFALMDSPLAKGLLMGAIFCTIAVPVLLYGILLLARNLRPDPHAPEETQKADAPGEGAGQ